MRRRSPSSQELLAARALLSDAEQSAVDDVLALRQEAQRLLDEARREAAAVRRAVVGEPSPAMGPLKEGLAALVSQLRDDLAALKAARQALTTHPPESEPQVPRAGALEALAAALAERARLLDQREAFLAERENQLTARLAAAEELARRRVEDLEAEAASRAQLAAALEAAGLGHAQVQGADPPSGRRATYDAGAGAVAQPGEPLG